MNSFSISQLLDICKWIIKVFKAKSKILVIEDNNYDATIIRQYLEDIGKTCKIVTTAEEAKGALINEKYRIIFTDIRLPLMGGIDLIKYIKERYPFVRNIIVLGEVHDLYKFPNGVFVSIIVKPVTLASIRETIKTLE